MDGRAPRFSQLPPDGGVHFAGCRDIGIPSRKQVIEKTRRFLRYCEQEARSVAARVLLGHWGEGKTELFHLYIRPTVELDGGRAYLISASSFASVLSRWRLHSILASEQVLAAALLCAREEARAEEIPSFGVSDSPSDQREWLLKALKAASDDGRRRIFIYIDEVEELLHQPHDLRRLLQGLKELVNGQCSAVGETGAFPGVVHFLISCTPEAYMRFSADPDVRQVFGGYDRRIEAIEIPPVTRLEAIRFLTGLLRFCYGGSLPPQLPVASLGVLNALAWAGQRNPGNMVSLLTRLLSALGIQGDGATIRVAAA